MDAQYTLVRIYLFVCRHYRGRLAATVQRQSNKGQKTLPAADKLYSEALSRIRQPIESLFNWIDEKTGIQRDSKVRSYQGLLVQAFGRLAAATLLLALNP